MIRILNIFTLIIGTLALVGGGMMAVTGPVLFVGSKLFPDVAEFRLQEVVAAITGGAVIASVGWIILRILTKARRPK